MKFTSKDRYYPTSSDLSDRAYEIYSDSDSLYIYKTADIWGVDFFGDLQIFNSLQEVSDALEEWGEIEEC